MHWWKNITYRCILGSKQKFYCTNTKSKLFLSIETKTLYTNFTNTIQHHHHACSPACWLTIWKRFVWCSLVILNKQNEIQLVFVCIWEMGKKWMCSTLRYTDIHNMFIRILSCWEMCAVAYLYLCILYCVHVCIIEISGSILSFIISAIFISLSLSWAHYYCANSDRARFSQIPHTNKGYILHHSLNSISISIVTERLIEIWKFYLFFFCPSVRVHQYIGTLALMWELLRRIIYAVCVFVFTNYKFFILFVFIYRWIFF